MNRRIVLAFVILTGLFGIAGAAQAETVLLRSALNGGYVGVGGEGALLAGYHKGRALPLERVRLQGNDKVAFRGPDGRYMRAGVGGHTGLAVASPHVRGWETFQQVPVRQGWVAFMSMQNGRFVTLAADGRTLVATDARITDRSTFIMEPVAAAPRRPAQQGQGNQPGNQQGNQQGRQPATNPMSELTANWKVEQFLDPRGRLVRPYVSDRAMEFFMDRAGNVHATAGCRRLRSVVRPDHGTIRFNDISVSWEDCSRNPDAFMTEETLRNNMQATRRWQIVRGKLHLQAAGGQNLIVLSRR